MMRFVEHAVCMGQTRNARKLLVAKPQLLRGMEADEGGGDNAKIDVEEIRWKGVVRTNLA
jgi:hypothetical protein